MGRTNDTRPRLEKKRLVVGLAATAAGIAWGLRLLTGVTPFGALLVFLGVMSLFAFVLFAIDKRRAATDERRVSEANLLGVSLFGGAAGGVAGMLLLRHKSRRWKFRILLTAFLLAHLAVVAIVSRPSAP